MRRGSQTVRQRSAKSHKSVRLRSTPPFFALIPDFLSIRSCYSSNKKTLPLTDRVFSCGSLYKLQRDRFAGAFADAGTAFDAFFFIDLGDAVDDFNRFDRTRRNAHAATGALAVVNFSSHFNFSLRIFSGCFCFLTGTSYPVGNLSINIAHKMYLSNFYAPKAGK